MLVLATSACSPSDSGDLYGIWLTPDNSNLLSINEDDTWTFSHQADPENIRGIGTFTLDGELLTLSTDPAWAAAAVAQDAARVASGLVHRVP